ncbi:MAG: aldose 1-epimerase family protein [Bacteroidales bacterium]|nr:aldose 1-epimerase family protein [Bacteroidales bacterium]
MKLSNGTIEIEVALHGAELASIKKDGKEYVWQADPKFWGRHAPILFPIVGKVWNDEYRVDGKTFNLPQHGFARDADFYVIKETADELILGLDSSKETLAKYPYNFHLEAKYTLEGSTVHILWTVTNPTDKEIYCSIGAHPAFNYPEFCPEDDTHAYAELYNEAGEIVKDLNISVLGAKGCCTPGKKAMSIEGGRLALKTNSFDDDAIIQEDSLVKTVTLFDKEGNKYLSLYSKCSEVMAIWSPVKKNAPFVCLEPWLGRADMVEYSGEYKDKDWMHKVEPKQSLEFDYNITV